jgi:hypothetical protein
MEEQYLSRLPPDLRSLVNEIEREGGVSIRVEVDSACRRGTHDQPGALACDVDQFEARILLPTPEYFPDGAVLHELLHIRRFLVDGIPRIVICEDCDIWGPRIRKFDSAIHQLDNILEHFIIVPEEIASRPQRKEHWIKVMNRVISIDLESPELSDGDRERYAQLNAAFVHHAFPNDRLVERARILAQKYGVDKRCTELLDVLIPALGSKERMVAVAFNHLRWPVDVVCLEYLDGRIGTCREVHLSGICKGAC